VKGGKNTGMHVDFRILDTPFYAFIMGSEHT
jgi:hypothetical protein